MRPARTSLISLAGLATAAVLAATAMPAQAAVSTKTLPLKEQVLTDARTAILNMMTKSSATDAQYYENGRFRYDAGNCPRCEVGPAVAAAALYRRTGDRQMFTLFTQTFDAAIRDQIKPTGGFSNGGTGEGGDDGIQTIFFSQHLGSALVYAGSGLDATRRATYTKTLTNSLDYLVKRGFNTWYCNGNINLALTVALGDAAKVTGSTKYRDLYEKSLAFTMSPGSKWSDYGYRSSKNGLASFGADSAGFLAEKPGSGASGFDPEYAVVQADLASAGYATIGDPRLLTLSNQLVNQLKPRVSPGLWAYDTSGGTRTKRPAGSIDRYSTAAYYLVAVNGRTAEKTAASSQALAVSRHMRDSGTNAWAGVYQMWGSSFSTLVATVS